MTLLKRIFCLLLFFSSFCSAQKGWGENLSIVNPIELNKIEVYSLKPADLIEIFGEPDTKTVLWSEWDDEYLDVYIYKNSTFSFSKSGTFMYFTIRDREINYKIVNLNDHGVGDSLVELQKDFPKSVENRIDNEVHLNLIHNHCITTDIVIFELARDIIKSISFQNLH